MLYNYTYYPLHTTQLTAYVDAGGLARGGVSGHGCARVSVMCELCCAGVALNETGHWRDRLEPSSGELEILSRVLVRVLGAALHLGCTPHLHT